MAAPLLNHMRDHGVPIYIPRVMNIVELKKSLNYGAHSSVVNEKAFVRKYLYEQLRAGHVSIFPLRDVKHLQVLCLSPLAAIPQAGRKPGLITIFLGEN